MLLIDLSLCKIVRKCSLICEEIGNLESSTIKTPVNDSYNTYGTSHEQLYNQEL